MPTALDTGARATTPAAARGAADGEDGAQGTHGALAEGGPPRRADAFTRATRALALATLAALIGLGLAWELWLAPTGSGTLA
nr:hypothetical protein [Rubrivivax sp.]